MGSVKYGSNQIITRVTGKFNFYTDGDYNMGGIEKLKDYCTKYDMTMIDDNPYDISILFDWDIKNEIAGLYCEDLFYKLRDVFEKIGCQASSFKLYVMKDLVNMFTDVVDNGIYKHKANYYGSMGGQYDGTEISYQVLETSDRVVPAPQNSKEDIYHIIYNLIVRTKGLGVTMKDILYFAQEKQNYSKEEVIKVVEYMLNHKIITNKFREDGILIYTWGRLNNL